MTGLQTGLNSIGQVWFKFFSPTGVGYISIGKGETEAAYDDHTSCVLPCIEMHISA